MTLRMMNHKSLTLLSLAFCLVFSFVGTAQAGTPVFVTQNLSSNRFDALPNDRLQVVVWYDGAGSGATLRIGYADPDTQTGGWITVGGLTDPAGPIENSGTQIETREYNLNGAELTGNFGVSGVVPNGGIDGLAFGLYWRDGVGNYHVLKSASGDQSHSAFVGAWPIAISDSTFDSRIPQVTDGNARAQARMAILGAEYLVNGTYFIPESIQMRLPKERGTTSFGDLLRLLQNQNVTARVSSPTGGASIIVIFDRKRRCVICIGSAASCKEACSPSPN